MKFKKNEMIKYINTHQHIFIDLAAVGFSIMIMIPFIGYFIRHLILLTQVLEIAMVNGMSDTYQLLFLCIILYLTIKIFVVIINAIEKIRDYLKNLK